MNLFELRGVEEWKEYSNFNRALHKTWNYHKPAACRKNVFVMASSIEAQDVGSLIETSYGQVGC